MKKLAFLISVFLFAVFALSAQTKKVVKKSIPVTPKPTHTTVMRGQMKKVEITTDYGIVVVRLFNETPKHRDNFIKLVKEGFYDSLMFHRVIDGFMIQGGDPQSKRADSAASLGNGDVGYRIPAEFNPALYHKKGALAMARDNNPEKASSGCQFYIVTGKKFTTTELEQIINSKNINRKQEIMYQMYQSDSMKATVSALQMSGDKEAMRKYLENLQPVIDAEYARRYPNATDVNMEQVEIYVSVGGAPHLDGDYTVFGEVEGGMDVVEKIGKMKTRTGDNRPFENIRMKMRLLE